MYNNKNINPKEILISNSKINKKSYIIQVIYDF